MGQRKLCINQEIIKDNKDFMLQISAKNSKESKMLSKFKMDFTFNEGNFSNKNNEIFFTLSSNHIDNNFRNVYKSEEKSLKSNYDEITISKDLIYDIESDSILIKLFDEDYSEIAEICLKIRDFKNVFNYQMSFSDKLHKKPLGKINLSYKEIDHKTFVDYLYSGMEINLSIGIDFTASNGSPKEVGSLHTFLNKEPNDYERAISSCGNILAYYDTDKIYPVFGFGAQFMGSNIVNHCFNITLTNDPNIFGIDNVINTYKENVMKLNFSGPTYFSPLIKNVVEMIKAKKSMNPSDYSYNILLILSDGQINDMTQTIDILVEASKLPLSVIIIGIGKADFSNMVTLGIFFNLFYF